MEGKVARQNHKTGFMSTCINFKRTEMRSSNDQKMASDWQSGISIIAVRCFNLTQLSSTIANLEVQH